MADRKITDLTALTTPASADVLPIVDVSEAAAADKNKKVTVGELFKGIPDGTAAAPAIAFESDDGNGLFLSTTDTIGISTNGVSRATVSTTAVTSTLPISATAFSPTSATVPTNGVYLPATNSVGIATNGSAAITIDSSQRVGIGSSSPVSGAQLTVAGSGLAVTGQNTDHSANSIRIGEEGSGAAQIRCYGPNTSTNGSLTFKMSRSDGSNSQDVVIDSSGRLGINTASPGYKLDVSGPASAGSLQPIAQFVTSSASGAGSGGYIDIGWNPSGTNAGAVARIGGVATGSNATELTFGTSSSISSAPTEAVRITSSGQLLVGASTALGNITRYAQSIAPTQQIISNDTGSWNTGLGLVNYSASGYAPVLTLGLSASNTKGTNTLVSDGHRMGVITFNGNDGTDFEEGARIEAFVDGTPGANDMPGRLVFSTTADGASSPTERMRISQDGQVLITNGNLNVYTNLSNYNGLVIRNDGSPGSVYHALFVNSGGNIAGSIQHSGSTSVSYNTSSDYRLKENVVAVVDGITRLQQLKPSRFNFIEDPDKTVDGFIAHEVQNVVPEAICGEKDAVDADGKPIYQGIDQSKLVPLLTAALQEAVAKIESLEARLTAAGI